MVIQQRVWAVCAITALVGCNDPTVADADSALAAQAGTELPERLDVEAGSLEATFPARYGGDPSVVVARGDFTVEFSAISLRRIDSAGASVDAIPFVDAPRTGEGETIVYTGIADDIDVAFPLSTNHIEQHVVLHTLPPFAGDAETDLVELVEFIQIDPDLTVVVDDVRYPLPVDIETRGAIELSDAPDSVVLVIDDAQAWDADGLRVGADFSLSLDASGAGTLRTTVPYSFLTAATYPVIIDPALSIQNCCAASSSFVGCNDEATQDCVCAVDPFCCSVVWDQICVNEVESLGCGDCVTTGDCCVATPGVAGCAEDSTIEACVCDTDPFCCGEFGGEWDELCALQVESLECATCETLDVDPPDPGLCGDGECSLNEFGIQEDCLNCPDDCRICGEDCCEVNLVGDPGCDLTEVQDCVCLSDPYCCNIHWDQLCVDEVDTFECGTCEVPGSAPPCLFDSDCDDDNECTEDTCDPVGGCLNLDVEDGTLCGDGDACNGDEVCFVGMCLPSIPPDCEDDNPCTVGSCDPLIGCITEDVLDGTDCSDGDLCNGAETCDAGACVSSGDLDCDDDNPCTDDQCDPLGGCINIPLIDGTPCTDGDVCDGDEICIVGSCEPGIALDCDDGDECTDDACDPLGGCFSVPNFGPGCVDTGEPPDDDRDDTHDDHDHDRDDHDRDDHDDHDDHDDDDHDDHDDHDHDDDGGHDHESDSHGH